MESPTSKGSHHTINQAKQHPLYFTNPLIDKISKTLTTFGVNQNQRIIYMGPRYTSTLKLLRSFSACQSRTQNKVQDSQIYVQEEVTKYAFINNQKQKYFPSRPNEYRLFSGVNPTIKKEELRFDSNFQCGNLDLVVSLSENQYDLFMRVDSNTKGHTCWFFFKVENFNDQQRSKFNIVNFSKGELSYATGMKIYTYASSKKQWIQSGQNIFFSQGHRYKYIEKDAANELSQYHSLSFQYQSKTQDQFVYFAYCVPYSYSFLQFKIKQLEKKYWKIIEVDRSNLSTGGIAIPVLTVTNKNQTQSKDVCLIISRSHPGQTQGSWLMHGFLNFLCSPKAKQLRNKVIFKIIPMVNVDGVVAGNFRTNFLGRDLNRYFHQPKTFCQIGLIRSLATKFKPFMFLDFHGHSSRKNVFTYGPDYPIQSRYFLSSRIFPKLVSKYTKSFRYHSCNFRISDDKVNTGRAILLRNHQIIYCFTIEASAHAYGIKKEEIFFNRGQYIQSGSMLCAALDKFVKIIFTLPKRYEVVLALFAEKNKQKFKSFNIMQNYNHLNDIQKNPQSKKLIQQILNDQKEKSQNLQKEYIQLQDSDFEQDNDYNQKQLKKMLKISDQPPQMSLKKYIKLLHNQQNLKKSYKNQSVHTQSYEQIEKSSIISDEQGISDQSCKKMQKLKIIKNESPGFQRDQSQSLQLNVQMSPSIDKSKIRLRGRHIKTIFSQQSCVITVKPVKIQNLNHLSLDYSVNKSCTEYQPLSEARRVKEKASILIKRRKGIEQLKLQQENTKNQKIHQIKKSLLPLLGTSITNKKQQGTSYIQEIFQKREIQRKNRISRQIKILYN